jgi:hypothetical protein
MERHELRGRVWMVYGTWKVDGSQTGATEGHWEPIGANKHFPIISDYVHNLEEDGPDKASIKRQAER